MEEGLRSCLRCGVISIATSIPIIFSVIIEDGQAISVCPFCLNEIREINIKKFEEGKIPKIKN